MLTPLTQAGVFSAAECDEIIRLAENSVFNAAGLVRGRRNESIRVAEIAWLDEEGEAAWVMARVIDTVLTANRGHFEMNLTEFAERIQVARYDACDEGHFDWHADCGHGPFAGKRKLTLVAQLSEAGDYEGGVLELNASGRPEGVMRERGTATLFPSFVLHRVTPVMEGRRYSLTTWVHGPAFV